MRRFHTQWETGEKLISPSLSRETKRRSLKLSTQKARIQLSSRRRAGKRLWTISKDIQKNPNNNRRRPIGRLFSLALRGEGYCLNKFVKPYSSKSVLFLQG